MENQKPNNKKRHLIRDVLIKPRTPKWEKQFLVQKEAEEYLQICRDGICHPAVKRVKKTHHFLKWAIKLIVPDFLIGHPNLWDNLKTLRKHPNFKPLRMALVAWILFTITISSAGIYSLNQAVRILAASPVTDTFTDETKIATSTQITVDTGAGQVKLSVVPWACGDVLTDSRDSKTYNTVLIGSQCWMAEHINVGTLIAGAGNQTNNATIEKYCYSDTEGNCTTDGGLYQWDETMQYAASCNGTGAPPNDKCVTPVQGICSAGWHIPSHYEYTTLEKNVGSNPGAFPYDESTTGWLGTNEGTNLKVGGSSGFEGLLAGYRSTSGSFYNRGTYSIIWSSLESGTTAWRRHLNSGLATVNRGAGNKLNGFSVRCIKD